MWNYFLNFIKNNYQTSATESNYARFLEGYEDKKDLSKSYNLYILK